MAISIEIMDMTTRSSIRENAQLLNEPFAQCFDLGLIFHLLKLFCVTSNKTLFTPTNVSLGTSTSLFIIVYESDMSTVYAVF
jgi:hypothetical protein